jgi:hypothetical protein
MLAALKAKMEKGEKNNSQSFLLVKPHSNVGLFLFTILCVFIQ